MNPSLILRGASALLGEDFAFDGRPLDLLVLDGRIKTNDHIVEVRRG